MSIDQHISVVARINNQGISLQGFGLTGTLSYTNLFPERSRVFGQVSELIDLGFAADGPEVTAAKRILGQSPRPKQMKVLRGTRPPTQKYEIIVEAAVEGQPYKINVGGEGVTPTTASVTPGAGDTEADIAGDLVTSLNAVAGKNYLAAVDGSDPSLIIVTGSAPGEWFHLELLSTTLMSIAQTHADPGVALDLAEILVADPNWYYLDTSFNSSAMVLEAAELIEATPFKAYIFDVVDSDVENTAAPGADVIAQWKALGYKRSLPFYYRKPGAKFAAGVQGRIAPFNVGQWTIAYLTITGVTADDFTPQQITNLDAKKASYYKVEADRSICWRGKVASAEYGFFDVTVSLDFVIDLIQKRLYAVRVALANIGSKVGYADEDIQGKLKPAGQGALDVAKSDKHKIIAVGTPGDVNDPPPLFTFPLVKDVDPSTRALRELPDGAASFRLLGAVDVISIDLIATF